MTTSPNNRRPHRLDGTPVELVLYKFDACPFCARVMAAIERLGLDIPSRDTRADPAARQELQAKGGKTQVPCLFIDGQPLYESAAIVEFLHNELQPA